MNRESKAKHTPAPWSVSERTYENSKGAKYVTIDHLVNGSGVEGLAVVYEGSLGEYPIEEMGSNARLIAASPELLEALKGLLSWSAHLPFAADDKVEFARNVIKIIEQ